MKVLFAVSNENISESIVKKYQKEYKEIISYKNVYYFNAILKEIQKDKTYDRIVISEDLEPFANNNYEQINKFIFEKLDSISDEASDISGNDTPIILICTDRRTKSEPILVKLFGIGIYSALIGQDRSITEVCKLIHKPRTKKEAKIYYKIDVDEVNYQSESENEVSEVEIQNIMNHYKRLGKNEDRYVDSFNNIASQYTDAQLKIIAKYLPLNVKAVLEAESPKYQSVMSFDSKESATDYRVYNRPKETKNSKKQKQVMEEPGIQADFIETQNKKITLGRPVIVPSSVNSKTVKKLNSSKLNERIKEDDENLERLRKKKEAIARKKKEIQDEENGSKKKKDGEKTTKKANKTPKEEEKKVEDPPKRKRGRPKKVVEEVKPESKEEEKKVEDPPKRKRGRPKKVVEEAKSEPKVEEEVNLFELEEDEKENTSSKKTSKTQKHEEETTLPGFDDEDEYDDDEYDDDYYEDEYDDDEYDDDYYEDEYDDDEYDDYEYEDKNQKVNKYENINSYESANKTKEISNTKTQYPINHNLDSLYTQDKKVVSFVGTTKNGTSFVINNLAELLSSTGIKTAILDVTKNKNSYYIYTRNEESLRKIAFSSIEKLRQGIAEGIKVNKNLDVYTTLPDEEKGIEDYSNILATLLENYNLILIDCDFHSPIEYFEKSQEIYLVQSMDVLTIQPLTAFLRDLKANNVLDEKKIRVVINKEQRVKSLSPKVIIGGMAFYNDPAMSFMTELFNKDMVKYSVIPFEEQIYSSYLEALVNCNISIKNYSKTFMNSLRTLGNMVYPLISSRYNPPMSNNYQNNNKFSANMNNTLEQMKKRY